MERNDHLSSERKIVDPLPCGVLYVAVQPPKPTVTYDVNVRDGDSRNLTCESSPPPPADAVYVWTEDDTEIPNARDRTYKTEVLHVKDNGKNYQCQWVVNGQRSQKSNPVIIRGMYRIGSEVCVEMGESEQST